MDWLVYCMPVILEVWKIDEHVWYHYAISFHNQFFVHFLADVFVELNKLSKKFQCNYVDITAVASTLDVTITMLRR